MKNDMDIRELYRPNIRSLAPYSTACDEYRGELGIFLAEPAAWLGADALLIPSYYLLLRRQKKLLEPNGPQPESLEESASN